MNKFNSIYYRIIYQNNSQEEKLDKIKDNLSGIIDLAFKYFPNNNDSNEKALKLNLNSIKNAYSQLELASNDFDSNVSGLQLSAHLIDLINNAFDNDEQAEQKKKYCKAFMNHLKIKYFDSDSNENPIQNAKILKKKYLIFYLLLQKKNNQNKSLYDILKNIEYPDKIYSFNLSNLLNINTDQKNITLDQKNKFLQQLFLYDNFAHKQIGKGQILLLLLFNDTIKEKKGDIKVTTNNKIYEIKFDNAKLAYSFNTKENIKKILCNIYKDIKNNDIKNNTDFIKQRIKKCFSLNIYEESKETPENIVYLHFEDLNNFNEIHFLYYSFNTITNNIINNIYDNLITLSNLNQSVDDENKYIDIIITNTIGKINGNGSYTNGFNINFKKILLNNLLNEKDKEKIKQILKNIKYKNKNELYINDKETEKNTLKAVYDYLVKNKSNLQITDNILQVIKPLFNNNSKIETGEHKFFTGKSRYQTDINKFLNS